MWTSSLIKPSDWSGEFCRFSQNQSFSSLAPVFLKSFSRYKTITNEMNEFGHSSYRQSLYLLEILWKDTSHAMNIQVIKFETKWGQICHWSQWLIKPGFLLIKVLRMKHFSTMFVLILADKWQSSMCTDWIGTAH